MTDAILRPRQGTTFQATLAMQDSAGDPVDLTGAEIVLFVASTPAISLTTADGGMTMADATNGRVSFELTPAQTRTFPAGRRLRWECERRIGGKQFACGAGYIIAETGISDD